MMMSIQKPITSSYDEETLKRPASSAGNATPEEMSLKKRKIEIDAELEPTTVMSDEQLFQAQLYKSYIRTALDALEKKKDHLAIDKLTSQINLPQSSVESLSTKNLALILRNLSQEITRIDNRHCQSLILSLINLPVVKLKDDVDFLQNYQLFVTVVASGIPKWWNEICNKLVADFVFEDVDSHHEMLQKIMMIIPTSVNLLVKKLNDLYPNKNSKKRELVNYVKNLLKVNGYCRELRFQVWCIIIENCIKLDVELQNELDELEEPELDDDDDEDDDDDDGEDDDEVEEEEAGDDDGDEYDDDDVLEEGEEIQGAEITLSMVTDLSGKLDSIMVLLLENTTNAAIDLDSGDGVELYNILSSLFKTHILPTHFTRCVQYLLFNLATRHEQLMDSFLYLLIEVSFQQKETLNNRLKSMQYISSFIARCSNLPKDKLVFVTSFLISWLNRFIQEREVEVDDTASNGLAQRFRLFYHCFQTLMYIFCFKYKDLKKKDDRGDWECGIDRFFQNAIITKFNPLKYCNDNVVKIFADLSARENACYCFSILETIKRESYGLNNKSSGLSELNGYFPFDPLMLKRSKKAVQDNYVDWNGNDDDEDDDDDDDDDK